MAAGVLTEQPGGPTAEIGFPHLLVHQAVYDDLSPTWRRRLHERATGLVDRDQALAHRVAASAGPDDGLAGELEAAGREARDLGRTAQAADWLAQAAAASSDPAAADRRLLDALEILVTCGEVARAEGLAARAVSGRGGPAALLAAGRVGFPGGPGCRGRGPPSAGVADPRPGPGRVHRRCGRYPAGGDLHDGGPGRGGGRVG